MSDSSDYGDSVVDGFVVGKSPLPFDAVIVIFEEYDVGKTKHNRQSLKSKEQSDENGKIAGNSEDDAIAID